MAESDKDRQARSRNAAEGIGPPPTCKSTRLSICMNSHSEKRPKIQVFTHQLVSVAVRTIHSGKADFHGKIVSEAGHADRDFMLRRAGSPCSCCSWDQTYQAVVCWRGAP
jgi:hypothetical protein